MSNSQNFKNRIQSPSASKNNTSGNNLIINTRHSKANNSTDFAIQTSSSSSSLAKMQNSTINNIKVFYNKLSKHLKKGKKEGDKLSRANTCTEENQDKFRNILSEVYYNIYRYSKTKCLDMADMWLLNFGFRRVR